MEYKDFTVDEKKNNFEISYTTEHIEKSNARLIQRKSKDESISIKVEKNTITIVSTAGEDSQPTVSKLIESLEQKSKKTLKKRSVNFSTIQSSEIINNFFLKLIKFNEKKYTLTDVIRLKLNKFNSSISKEVDLELIDADDDSIGEIIKDQETLKPNTNKTVDEGSIKSALISGSSLLTSKVFESFSEQGYFISAITWVLVEKGADKKRIELFAGFTDPDDRSSFSYELKWYYLYNKKTGTHNKGKQKFKYPIKNSLDLEFHNTALKIYDDINFPIQKQKKELKNE